MQQKKRSTERDWRNSWGSNQSYSSCSLQSNATNIIGKDDFWLALQPNYNFIMDTNLLDSCREARGELERNYPPETNHTELKAVSNLINNVILFFFFGENLILWSFLCRKSAENHMMNTLLI